MFQVIDAENIDVDQETASDGVNVLFEHQLPLISFASPGIGVTNLNKKSHKFCFYFVYEHTRKGVLQ